MQYNDPPKQDAQFNIINEVFMTFALLIALGLGIVTGVNLPSDADSVLKAPDRPVHFESTENKRP